jgi:hypothetical protein
MEGDGLRGVLISFSLDPPVQLALEDRPPFSLSSSSTSLSKRAMKDRVEEMERHLSESNVCSPRSYSFCLSIFSPCDSSFMTILYFHAYDVLPCLCSSSFLPCRGGRKPEFDSLGRGCSRLRDAGQTMDWEISPWAFERVASHDS